MEVKLFRKNKVTEGQLSIEGLIVCDTLEDRWRDLQHGCKVPGDTCVPAGRYRITWDFSHAYARKMLRVNDVPRFDNVFLREGEDRGDTQGSILVGRKKRIGRLEDSRETLRRIESVLLTAFNNKREVWLTVADEF